jgi:addiction module RelB/DinJ family antitoxin
MEYDQSKVDEMLLALMHLTSFSDHGVTRSWKGYDSPSFTGNLPNSPICNHAIDKRPHLGHIGPMSAIAKSRIDPELKRQAEAVLEEIGLKPRAALELFYKQIIKRRAIPFPVQADSPEDEVLSPAARRNALADEF